MEGEPAAKALLTKCREYGAEEIMGQAIKELNWKRSDLGTQACLKRLQMDYVDVLFFHRPDSSTPIEETVCAMNYQITEAWAIADRLNMIGPTVEQPQYNLLACEQVEVEYAPLYKNYGLGLTTWSPLGSGVLTGKYSIDSPLPENSRFSLENYKNVATRKLVKEILDKVDALKPIAERLGMKVAQLAIAWCLKDQNGLISAAELRHVACKSMDISFQHVQSSLMSRDNDLRAPSQAWLTGWSSLHSLSVSCNRISFFWQRYGVRLRVIAEANKAKNGLVSVDTSVNPRVAALRPSKTMAISDYATALVESGVPVIRLAANEPDFVTPKPIVEAGMKAIPKWHV
ncbi:hypothetical protein KP509_20G035300 [Ceratopteris richardii]|uniref:NADP-dependent oxidoreductase domain-containing protein n=1 Tax=Ceratopteris richardii TaxID=49495 RepID=A0A8T2SF33_CERRI|nr:hypothetical protein KP509_20G035300 [Ceratopteris richardii]